MVHARCSMRKSALRHGCLVWITLLAALAGQACGGSESSSTDGTGGSGGASAGGGAGASGANTDGGGANGANTGGADSCPAFGCDPNCGDAGVQLDNNGCATCSCNPEPDAAISDARAC